LEGREYNQKKKAETLEIDGKVENERERESKSE